MDREVLLSVQNLQQYFKLGKFENKAVDNVSFDIYKGEVFGLVGESGCGKTTTGRSIIRLYDITGGSVYYKGQRICAGTRSYKDAIANARVAFKEGSISKEELDKIRSEFDAGFCDDIETINTIEKVYNDYGYLMDTHTAVAWSVYEKWAEEILATPLIRHDTKQSIIEHGYDITASSQKLVELYLK